MQRHKGECQGWKRRLALAGMVLGGLLAVWSMGQPLRAGSKLYDMDRMLNEPHPFALTPPIARPTVQPRFQPGLPAKPKPAAAGTVKPAPLGQEKSDNDPLEPINRFVFGFNEILYEFLLRPIARGYNAVLPDFMRDGIRNS